MLSLVNFLSHHYNVSTSWMHCFNMKMSLFVTTVISQGSVATDLQSLCCKFIAKFNSEKNWKSVNICQSYGQKHRGPFLTHSVVATTVYICRFSTKAPTLTLLTEDIRRRNICTMCRWLEYRNRKFQVAGSTSYCGPFASNLEQVASPRCVQVNTLSFAGREMSSSLRGEGLV